MPCTSQLSLLLLVSLSPKPQLSITTPSQAGLLPSATPALPAGAILAFVIPGWLGLAMQDELTETQTASCSRRLAGALLCLVGLVVFAAGISRLLFFKDPLAGE